MMSKLIFNATEFKPLATDSPIILDSSDNCTGSSSIDPSSVEVDYAALEYSMMITTLTLAASAFFFFITALYVNARIKKLTLNKHHYSLQIPC